MTQYQIVDLYLQLSTKQDALWAIFFSVHMAMFGGIIYVDRPLKPTEKIFAVIAYLIFAVLNFVAVRAGQRLMGALRTDLSELESMQEKPTHTASLFESAGIIISSQGMSTLVIHLVAGMLVIGAIIFDRERTRDGKSSKSA